MVKAERSYKCPYCGYEETFVVQTISVERCVIRKRKCRVCGLSHITGEAPIDLESAIYNTINTQSMRQIDGVGNDNRI